MSEPNQPNPQHEIDAHTLSPTELREKYASTYSSWRNMKQRRKTDNAVIHPAFEGFAEFLIQVGPRPGLDYTLDRIDPSNPEYGPDRVRWLDKKGQANNRSTTVMLTVNGQTKPLAVWASETNQKADTLRARRSKGWTDEEVVFGQVSSNETQPNPWNYRPWPKEREQFVRWERFYQANGAKGQLPIDFFIQELKRVIWPRLDYISDNDGISPEMDAKCRAVEKEIEPLQKRLEEALREQPHIHKSIRRYPRPYRWAGPKRFSHNPD